MIATEHIDGFLEAEEELYPTRGDRRFYSGFYDRAAQHGEIRGSGPGFEAAMSAFRERERQRGLPGVWRSAHWNQNHGTQRDIDYAIMEWI